MQEYFELYKSGYVHSDGKEEENKFIKKAATREELFKYAVANKFELWDYFINWVVEKVEFGIVVPETINEYPVYLNEILDDLDLTVFECELGYLAHYYDQLLNVGNLAEISKRGPAEGFTIGRGKQLFWFISPSAKTGKYACYPSYEDGTLGYPRYYYPEQKVKIHFKK